VHGPTKIAVLIADGDDELLGQAVRWLAAARAIAVVGALSDGDAAVCLARQHQPDVVLMDLSLPGRGGIDATERIITWLPRTSVIMVAQIGCDPRRTSRCMNEGKPLVCGRAGPPVAQDLRRLAAALVPAPRRSAVPPRAGRSGQAPSHGHSAPWSRGQRLPYQRPDQPYGIDMATSERRLVRRLERLGYAVLLEPTASAA